MLRKIEIKEIEFIMGLFTNKCLMITGGSFGNSVLSRFLKTDIGEIHIFSRDEKKQDDMRHHFQTTMPDVADKIKFYIGDVRDLQSVRSAMPGVDYIFHVAALKQVPRCSLHLQKKRAPASGARGIWQTPRIGGQNLNWGR